MKLKKLRLMEGTLKRHPEGFGFFIPDDKDHPDVYIPSGRIGSALTNDRVQVSVHQKRKGGSRSFFGFIHSILKRDKAFVTGIFTIKRDQTLIQDHNLGCSAQVFVSNPKKITVKEGDFVKAQFNTYPSGNNGGKLKFKTDLAENFGSISSLAKDDVKRIMAEYNILFDFPQEVLNEVKSLPDKVREKDYADRKDLRDRAFVTIDGITAQDFDDAVFVEKLPSSYRLYVAIADVSYYVQEDSFLDQSAFERGNSSYFPYFCSPMLPEKLSSDLCSLKEGEERLVIAQEMDFDFKGELIGAKIYPSVISSRKRLTYGQAQDILDDPGGALKKSSAPFFKPEQDNYLESLRQAKFLTQILLKRHLKEQALNLDIPETLVLVNPEGEPQDILKEKRLFSHLMIEQFMLAANKAVSAFLEQERVPLMYRIHEKPEEEKLEILEKFSKTLGFSKSFKSRKNLSDFLNKYKNHSKIELIHKLVLRSLSQARYSAFNKGHYGLNFSSYTHFTSPIRRYCDLLIHRLVKQALLKEPEGKVHRFKKPPIDLKETDKNPQTFNSSSVQSKKKAGESSKLFKSFQREIEKQALFISQREQNSVQAERMIKDIKIARLLKRHLGQSFSGYVSSVCSFGLFITLNQFFAEGLVRFQDMRGFWESDKLQLFAQNKRTAYKIQFGDPVKVLITASQVRTGKVDFKLLSHKGHSFN